MFFYEEGSGFHWFLGLSWDSTGFWGKPWPFGSSMTPRYIPELLEGLEQASRAIHRYHEMWKTTCFSWLSCQLTISMPTYPHTYIYIYIYMYKYIYTYTYLAANITAGPGSLHQPPRGSYRDATEAFHRRSGECHQPWPVGGQFECDFWGPANFNCSWPGAFAVEFCYKTSLIDLDPDRLTASYLDVWLHGTCRNLIARLWDCPGIEHRRGKSSMIASCINVHLVKVSCISTYFDPFVAITQTGSHDHHYKRQIPPSGRFCGRWTCCSQKIAIWGSFATQAWLRPIRRLYWGAIGYSGYRVSDVSTLLLLLFCADWIRWLQRCLQNDVKASKSHEFQYHHDI